MTINAGADVLYLSSRMSAMAVTVTEEAPASDAPLDSIGALLDKLDTRVVYLQSFEKSDLNGLAVVGNYPLFAFNAPPIVGGVATVNLDIIGFLDDGVDGGVGGSITLERVANVLNVGIGYAPRGYGWSGYIGVAKLF
jgi:hypothetical protein